MTDEPVRLTVLVRGTDRDTKHVSGPLCADEAQRQIELVRHHLVGAGDGTIELPWLVVAASQVMAAYIAADPPAMRCGGRWRRQRVAR